MLEGLNNKIRVLRRLAYGYRDEDGLKRKIVAACLHSINPECRKRPTVTRGEKWPRKFEQAVRWRICYR